MDIWDVSILGLLCKMMTLIHKLIWTYVLVFVEYIPRRGITGSYGNSLFNLWGPPNCSAKQLYKSSFPSAIYEAPNISPFSLTRYYIVFSYSGDNFETEGEHLLIISVMNQVWLSWANWEVQLLLNSGKWGPAQSSSRGTSRGTFPGKQS